MPEEKGSEIILRLRRRWTYQGLFVTLAVAVAITVLLSMVLYKFLLLNLYWALPLAVIFFALLSLTNRWWRLSEIDVTRFLNQSEPALQESTGLLLQPYDSLSGLQKLQRQKVEKALTAIRKPAPFKRKLLLSMAALLLAVIGCAILFSLPLNRSSSPFHFSNTSTTGAPSKGVLPKVQSASVTILPPGYTGKPARTADSLNLQMEEGGTVVWTIKTNMAVSGMKLIFNDGTALPLVAISQKKNTYKTQKSFIKPGFYQLQLEGKASELYKIEIIKDKVPTITIQTPKPTTTVEYGQSEGVPLRVTIADDYGIKTTGISATISSGEGEAVKFKEQKLSFSNFTPGGRQYNLHQTLDLKALGLQPGDELYFFITATDSHNQETRSDVYIIELQDTTQLSSMDGMVNGLDVKPDLFRSERQIIIETEQLLKDRSRVSVQEFQQKSSDLGVDQKLLRLRYGKFLGEETDTEIGEHADEGEHAGNVDGAAQILEQYGHAHDNAEDASFFDAPTKKQLKETLAEMWKAELQLRTYNPKAALPFEYKALSLLKDLQQKSRAYVAKTGVKTTPLKMDKRLTGDLSKIGQPVAQQNYNVAASPEEMARKAIGVLEQLKEDGSLPTASREMLQQAFQQLSSKAAQNPAQLLPALAALRTILADTYRLKDINTAGSGLQQMLAPPTNLPTAAHITNDLNLSGRYFKNLNSHK